MNCLRQITKVALGILLIGLCCQLGCQPQQPFYLTEKGQYQKHMITKATRIDYPDAEVPSTMEVCSTMAPLTLDNPNPTHYWDLSLEEAIQMALKNSKVVRTLNGVSFSKSGVAGVAGALLSSPNSIGTVYDPALIESNPQAGVEAALSVFDGQLTMGTSWGINDTPAGTINGGNRSDYATNSGVGSMNVGVGKNFATGGSAYMTSASEYADPMNSRGTWSTYLEGGFSQPLLQGNGIQFNRIAGFGSQTPGNYNGVAIARINTDTALNDFEMNTRNLVADVEKAYWNLYYAYHALESVKSGRDSAHQTWSQTYAMYMIGSAGGRAQFEAQARSNYFAFRSQTETAQSNLFKAESTLRYIVGLTSTDGRLIRPIDEPIIAPLRLDWQSVMCEALHRSPELRKQKWDVKKKELELIASKNYLLPRLDFNAKYRFTGAGHHLINSTHHNNAFDSMTSGNYGTWVLGLNASMPFGWRRELAGVRHAQLNLAKSRALLQEQELELTHQLADSFREISAAYQQSRTMLQRRIAADAEVSSVNAAYKAGTTTLDQLLEAQKRQAEAESEYYRAIVDYNLAIMTLHYRKGSLLEYNNVCLVEGPWASKAYFDAKRRARARDAGHYMDYGFTRPRVVSRNQYQQFQHNGNMIMEHQPMPKSQGQPKVAPPVDRPIKPPTPVLETQGKVQPSPLPTQNLAVVPASGQADPNPAQGNTQVSFTAPQLKKEDVAAEKTDAKPTRNRYLSNTTSELPIL